MTTILTSTLIHQIGQQLLGKRVRVYCSDTPSTPETGEAEMGIITALDHDFISIVYDGNSYTDELVIHGFANDPETEAKAYQRVYLVEDVDTNEETFLILNIINNSIDATNLTRDQVTVFLTENYSTPYRHIRVVNEKNLITPELTIKL